MFIILIRAIKERETKAMIETKMEAKKREKEKKMQKLSGKKRRVKNKHEDKNDNLMFFL